MRGGRLRVGRRLVSVLRVAGLAIVFAGSAASAVALHANLPPARRLGQAIAQRLLDDLFEGRIVLGRIERVKVGLSARTHVRDVTVLAPNGRLVLAAHGVEARLELARLLASLARGHAPDIAVDEPTVDDAEIVLDEIRTGTEEPGLAIGRTFRPRRHGPEAEAPAAPPSPTHGTLALVVADARLRHAWVHGDFIALGSGHGLDGDTTGVRATLRLANEVVTIDVPETQVLLRTPTLASAGGPATATGRANGALRFELGGAEGVPALAKLGVWTEFVGDAQGMPFTARAVLDAGVLEGSLDVPRVAPDVAQRAFPIAPIEQPVDVRASVAGYLPTLSVHARAHVGGGAVAADGKVTLVGAMPFAVDLAVAHLDARAIGAAPSDLTATGHVEGELERAPHGTFAVRSPAGAASSSWEGTRLPVLAATGSFDSRKVDAHVEATDDAAEARAALAYEFTRKRLAYEVDASTPDLFALRAMPGQIRGAATAHAVGTVDLVRVSHEGHATLTATHLARGIVGAASARAEVTLEGPLRRPTLDVTASAKDVALVAPGKEPLVYSDAQARGRVMLTPEPMILDAELQVTSHETTASAEARELRVTRDGVRVVGARVTGLGEPLALDVDVARTRFDVRAQSTGLDLHRVAAVTGVAELGALPPDARAWLDLEVRGPREAPAGHLDLKLTSAQGMSGELHGATDGHRVTARARAEVAGLGWVEMPDATLDLPDLPGGSPLSRALGATGTVEARGVVDLGLAASSLTGEGIEQIGGSAEFELLAERGTSEGMPVVRLSSRTRALDVQLSGDRRIVGADLALHAMYDGSTDDAEVAITTWDARGMLGSADAKARLPLGAWLRGATKPTPTELANVVVRANVDVPRRAIRDVPEWIGVAPILGQVYAHAEVGGTLAHPDVTLALRGEGLRGTPTRRPSTSTSAGPERRYGQIDAAVDARWTDDSFVVAARADESSAPGAAPSTSTSRAAHLRALVLGRLPAADVIAGKPLAETRWTASGEVDVFDLDLTPLPLPYRVTGALTGRLRVLDLGSNGGVEAHAHVDNLGFGSAQLQDADLDFAGRDGAMMLWTRVRQENGGGAVVQIDSQALRFRGTHVDWDASRRTRLAYSATNLELGVLRPFVWRVIPELSGRIDGQGSATFDAHDQAFDGGLAVTEGRVYLTPIGEQLSGIIAVARFEKNGNFRIADARGRIGSGEFSTSAEGHLKGLSFESATATVDIPSREGIPLSSEGAVFADANGEIRLSARMGPAGEGERRALLIAANVPRSRITLPRRGTQSLQSIDKDPAVAVGIREPDGSLEPLRMPPSEIERAAAQERGGLETRVTVDLGDDVLVEGRGIRAYLLGRLEIDFAREVTATGQVRVRSGSVDVQGRKFVIDTATLTFPPGGQFSDPTVLGTAYWDAPDKTRVWVEFSGPLKSGKMTLRSEPSLSQNEILALLLFGRPDANVGGAQSAQGTQTGTTAGSAAAGSATAVGGGIVSSGLNRALDELSGNVEVEANVATTREQGARPEINVQLRRNLSVRVGYVVGPPTPREPDRTIVSADWQFVPRWSLVGIRGDKGTSILDVLYRYRY